MAINYVSPKIDEIVTKYIKALKNEKSNDHVNYIAVTRKIKDDGIKNPIFGINLASILIRFSNQNGYKEREVNFYYSE